VLIVRGPRQQPIELIDGARPERLVTRNPSASLLQCLVTKPKPMNSAFNRPFHQSGSL
jgi:hypothetical protein